MRYNIHILQPGPCGGNLLDSLQVSSEPLEVFLGNQLASTNN